MQDNNQYDNNLLDEILNQVQNDEDIDDELMPESDTAIGETPAPGETDTILDNTLGDDYNDFDNMSYEVRVAYALYLNACNYGVMTDQGALLRDGVNMPQLAKQAEVNVNFAIKILGNLRKQSILKNRKTDGRLLIKLDLLEEYLTSNGAVIDF